MPHRSSPSASWRARKYRYSLVGTMCGSCKELFYPPRDICPKCRKTVATPAFLSGSGIIESFTTIHNPPAGFEEYAPYVVAVIKLDEGARVSAQVVNRPEECRIGARVRSVFRKLYKDGESGLNFYGAKFKIV